MKKEVFGTFLMGKAIEARALLEACNEETEPERYNYLFGRYQAMDEALNVLEALPDAKSEPSANWSGASVKSSGAKGTNDFTLARMDFLLGRQPIHMAEFGGI